MQISPSYIRPPTLPNEHPNRADRRRQFRLTRRAVKKVLYPTREIKGMSYGRARNVLGKGFMMILEARKAMHQNQAAQS